MSNCTRVPQLLHEKQGCFISPNLRYLVVDYALFGHTFDTIEAYDDSECATRCMTNATCQSYNIQTKRNSAKLQCELNNNSRASKPQDFRRKAGFTYFGLVQVRVIRPCAMNSPASKLGNGRQRRQFVV